jgi:phasin family protein
MEKIMSSYTPQFDTKQFEKMSSDAAEMSREGFDAVVKSTTLYAKGMEAMMRMGMEMAQSAAEKQAEFAKQAMSSKTMNEFSELQNKMAQTSFDDFMAGATQMSEMTVKTMSEASEPVNEQMTKAMNSMNVATAQVNPMTNPMMKTAQAANTSKKKAA